MSINVYTRPVGQKERQLTNFVKVKRIISRDGAVETRLEKRRPAVAEFVRTAAIRFANAGDSRIHRLLLTGQNLLIKKQFPKKKSIATYFSAVHVFDGRFPEREVNVISVGERADKVGSCCCQTGSKDVIYKKEEEKKSCTSGRHIDQTAGACRGVTLGASFIATTDGRGLYFCRALEAIAIGQCPSGRTRQVRKKNYR